MPLGKAIGEEVRRRRLEAKLSQEKLAWKAGLSRNTLARLEAGMEPRLGTLDKLAEALGCALEDLFPEDGKVSA